VSIPEDFSELAGEIKLAVPDGVGFALLMTPGSGDLHYASTGHRHDVVTAIEEWLARTSSSDDVGRKETADQLASRKRLEAHCAELGHVLMFGARGTADTPGLLFVLVLFDYGEGGSLAYFTNDPHVRTTLRLWCTAARESLVAS
jgi:hypothetical protein